MRVNSLDGLRAVLALWVVLAHLAMSTGVTVPLLLLPSVAVDLFMVLSGFLIASTYERLTLTQGLQQGMRSFWIRRAMRIWPLYVFLLSMVWWFAADLQHWTTRFQQAMSAHAGGAMVQSPSGASITWADAAWHYSMLFGLNPAQATSTGLPDWSLSLEFQFYLLFPFIAVLYRRWPLWLCFVSAGLAYVSPALLGDYQLVGRWAHFRQPALLTYRLNFFLVGCIAYRIFSVHAQPSARPQELHKDLVALLLCLSVAGVRSALGIILVMFVLSHPASALCRWFSTRPMAWMGRISFSIYLVHMPLLKLVLATLVLQPAFMALGPPGRFGVAALCLVPLVLLASHGLYRLIEQPGNRLAHRWTSGPKVDRVAVGPRQEARSSSV
jgi:peptidoglycan/LPS O-acetylase OafA/YrhL